MSSRRFVFNLPQAPAFTDDDDQVFYFTGNDPALVMEEYEGGERGRHSAQVKALGDRALADEHVMFDRRLDWAYRGYIVQRLWVDDERERGLAHVPDKGPGLGSAPPRPVDRRPLLTRKLLQALGRQGPAEPEAERLYLFNVIVSLEWVPSPQRLRRLEWAFRRASDYLYDVTNGAMAFGQVVFADVTWMGCADIQILASNRFLPRSWVGGLLLPHKYTPIRVGRGLWLRDRRVVVDWDEPEGYRELIHEWAHYALGMKDSYLAPLQLGRDAATGRLQPAGGAAPAEYTLVLPKPRLTSESIMATAVGNSELSLSAPELFSYQVDLDRFYPGLKERLADPSPGPGHLPLPLPIFRYAGAITVRSSEERVLALPFLPGGAAVPEEVPFVDLDDDNIPRPRWDLYLAQYDDRGDLRGVRAQGEVDARAPEHGFTLLGARSADTVLLYGQHEGFAYGWRREVGAGDADLVPGLWQVLASFLRQRQGSAPLGALASLEVGQPEQLAGTVAALHDQLSRHLSAAGWSLQSLLGGEGARPAYVDVVPRANERATRASIRLQSDVLGPEAEVTVCSLDGSYCARVRLDAEIELPTLDGYVLTGPPSSPLIMLFSQGGGPALAPNVTTNPIAAGAASGDALLFFHDPTEPRQAQDFSHHRVVTTILAGLSYPGIVPASPVYSIASSHALPPELHPTLMILNLGAAAQAQPGRTAEPLSIFRVTGGKVEELPTYTPATMSYAAVSLARIAGNALLDEGAPVRVERFVLGRRA